MVACSLERFASSVPPTWMLPSVGVSSPPSMLSRVDLPEPEVPMMAVNLPRSMSRFTPSSARTCVSPLP